jgi:DNA-binding NarL/FixJ family response regulator
MKPCVECGHDPSKELTPQQVKVVNLIARGFTTKEIAKELYNTEATIRNHIQSIFAKLEVHTRLQAALEWQKRQKEDEI